MTEQGADADNASAVEHREAQRPTSLAARTPQAATPGDREFAVGAMAGREVRPAGLVSLLDKGGDPPWRLPALHSLARGEKENRDAGSPQA
jgi:hypothetical protein